MNPSFLSSASSHWFQSFGLMVPHPQPVPKGTMELSRIPKDRGILLLYFCPASQFVVEYRKANIVSIFPVPKVGVCPSWPTHARPSVAAQGSTVFPALVLT